jgi:5-methylcytosine-specific restriction endonuclease McrBC regulatory subunit McrC
MAVLNWLRESQDKKIRAKASIVLNQLKHFDGVIAPSNHDVVLVQSIPKLASSLPPQHRHYSEALWAAYVILQGLLPDPTRYGYMSLDSMVVDISAVFEGYTRNVLVDHPEIAGVIVKDGNSTINKCSFFSDPQERVMKPDIIFECSGKVVAIADVKYKQSVNEHDRYELLSFMEATGAREGFFVCPKTISTEESSRLGTTLGGKRMSLLRFDLAASDMVSEEKKFAKAVRQVIDGASL